MEGWRQQAMSSLKLNHKPEFTWASRINRAARGIKDEIKLSLTPTGLLMEGLIGIRAWRLPPPSSQPPLAFPWPRAPERET
jgi:hypothetical protein